MLIFKIVDDLSNFLIRLCVYLERLLLIECKNFLQCSWWSWFHYYLNIVDFIHHFFLPHFLSLNLWNTEQSTLLLLDHIHKEKRIELWFAFIPFGKFIFLFFRLFIFNTWRQAMSDLIGHESIEQLEVLTLIFSQIFFDLIK